MLEKFKSTFITITENRNKIINESSYWNNNGQFQEVYEKLWAHVPPQGPTKFLETELLRALAKIYYRCFNDGDYLIKLCDENQSIVYAYNFIKQNAPNLNEELQKLITTDNENSYKDQLDVLLNKFLENVDTENLTPSTEDYQNVKYRFFDDDLTLSCDEYDDDEYDDDEYDDDLEDSDKQ